MFKRFLYPATIAASALNIAGFGYAVALSEPGHAFAHTVIAAAFAFWAHRVRPAQPMVERQPNIDLLEGEVSDLRRELNDTRERLDFAERLLETRHAQRIETER